MRLTRLTACKTALFIAALSAGTVFAQEKPVTTASLLSQTSSTEVSVMSPSAPYNGWGFLVDKLRTAGIPEAELGAVYNDPRMPAFSFIPFRLRPKEQSALYTGFTTPTQIAMGTAFARQHKKEFDRIEKAVRVPREVVTAIVLVESQLGQNTGKALVLERLSRVASVREPTNLQRNLEAMRQDDPKVSLEQLEERALYLEKTFLPEIPALFEISRRHKLDPLTLRGSMAGAFGLPQFLPSAFLRFAVDGDSDGDISLFDDVDAIWSAAQYLASYGYRDELPLKEKRLILWRYNKSEAYIDTILSVSRAIKSRLRTPSAPSIVPKRAAR
jgi:membrane-bound lytic murein transglycosylase B